MEQAKTSNSNEQKPQVTETQQTQQTQPQTEEDEITQQTIDHFNKICLDATQIMNEYKLQSVALKQQIAGIVSVYQKSSQGATDAVPVDKIISITNEYEQGMKEANREYQSLADELKHEEEERNQIVFQIKDCFDKLERMEQKIKEKKRKQAQEKQKLEQEMKAQETKQEPKIETESKPQGSA